MREQKEKQHPMQRPGGVSGHGVRAIPQKRGSGAGQAQTVKGPVRRLRAHRSVFLLLKRAMLSITCAVSLSRYYSFFKSLLPYQFLRKLLPDPTPPVPG